MKIDNFEKAETLFGYSCIARSMIYSNCVKWELTPYESTNMCGCITEGEIACFNGKNTFANCSFVVSAIGENPCKQKYNPYAFTYTNSLSADNERMLRYLTEVEKMFINNNNNAPDLKLLAEAYELKLLKEGINQLPNNSAMLMDIELRGVDRMCFINVPETSMIKAVFKDTITSITQKQFFNKCETFAHEHNYKIYQVDNWTAAIGTTSYTVALTDFEQNMQKLREILIETSEGCVPIIPIICLISEFNADNIYDIYNAGLAEMNKRNIQFLVYNDLSDSRSISAFKNKYSMLNIINYAIANDGVVPYYQGIHNNTFSCIKHYESLMRLVDEKGNIYYPGQFLDTAREFGTLYDSISSIMIQKVFERFKDSDDTKVSINLGIRDIQNNKLMTYIYDFLSTALHPDNFIFEILENEDINNYALVNQFVKHIHTLGAKVSLDDFGSGFSNLQHVINLDFDYIKIDGSIVKQCAEDLMCERLIAIISNWKKMSGEKLSIIAEFVENEKIQNLLLKYGIDYSQGYLFSRPAANLIDE